MGKTIQRLFPGVYINHTGPIDDDVRLRAAHLWAGEGAVLTGIAALRRQGLKVNGSDELVFLVGNGQRARTFSGVRTVRCRRLGSSGRWSGFVPLTDLARALADAARHQKLGGANLKAPALSALQRGQVTPEAITHELEQGTGHPLHVALREAVEAFTDGAWSLPEVALQRVAAGHPDLCTMLLNPRIETAEGVFVGVPDGFFPEHGLAVQVHSRTYHSGTSDQGEDLWMSTVEKDGVYPQHGIVVIGITPASLTWRPDWVATRLATILPHYAGRDLSHLRVHPHG